MALTLTQLVQLLNDATAADRQLGMFPFYINHAVQELCNRRSWVGMKNQVTFTIPSGNGSANLPSNFKEPQSGLNALQAQSQSTPTGFDLWFLYSKQELERLAIIGVDAPSNKAYIDWNPTSNCWTVTTLGQVGSDTNFSLDCYTYFPDLVNPTDTNYMTTFYPFLVLEQAKVYAFRHAAIDNVTGQLVPGKTEFANQCQAEVERLFAIASADDAYKNIRGRRFRMGGF